jgi:hypothetical protein
MQSWTHKSTLDPFSEREPDFQDIHWSRWTLGLVVNQCMGQSTADFGLSGDFSSLDPSAINSISMLEPTSTGFFNQLDSEVTERSSRSVRWGVR